MTRALVAGIGNILCKDDGFGSEVARRLRAAPLPAGAVVVDFGISSLHLALDLLEPFDLVVVIDVVARGGAPGTTYLLEVDPPADDATTGDDTHGMNLSSALKLARRLGAPLGRILLVGCEPSDVADGIGLSAPVAGAVDLAAAMVRGVLARELCRGTQACSEDTEA